MTILDFTSRLPGPLGLSLLARRGARVIKIEDRNVGDAFKRAPLDPSDHSFNYWYHEINQHKEVIELDFKGPDFKAQLHSYLQMANAFVAPKNKFFQTLLADVAIPVGLFLTGAANQAGHTPLHDLNILAQTGLLDLHARADQGPLSPPFLPVAGVSFAAGLALDLLSALYEQRQSKAKLRLESSLEAAVSEQLAVLFPARLAATGERHFLHNGNYPCYNIYRTRDHHGVALACIEENYWVRFCQIFNLSFTPLDRFTARARNPKLISLIQDLFAAMTLAEVKARLKSHPDGEQICVTPFLIHQG